MSVVEAVVSGPPGKSAPKSRDELPRNPTEQLGVKIGCFAPRDPFDQARIEVVSRIIGRVREVIAIGRPRVGGSGEKTEQSGKKSVVRGIGVLVRIVRDLFFRNHRRRLSKMHHLFIFVGFGNAEGLVDIVRRYRNHADRILHQRHAFEHRYRFAGVRECEIPAGDRISPVFEDGKQFTVEHALHESPVGFVLAFKHLHVYLALRPRRSVERRHRLAQYADQDLLNAGHAQPVIDRPVPGTFIVFVLDVAFFRNHRPP